MKICIVSHSAGDGGAERVLLEAVEPLHEAGAKCLVVLPGEGRLARALADRGAECKVLRYGWWVQTSGTKSAWRSLRSARSSLAAALKLAAYLLRNPCDVVVTNTISTPVGGLAAALVRVPHIWWIHEFGEEDHGLEFDLGMRFSTRFMDRTSRLVFASSAAVASKYARFIERNKVHTLYCGVHLDFTRAEALPALASKAGRPRVCIVGRITEGKGQEDAIHALRKLRRGGTDATLLVVGPTSDYSRQIKKLSLQLGLGDRVLFTGYVDNALPIVSSCDVAIVCSRCEAFGRVTIEAMKLGKPVVGTRAGGTVELIKDGINGFLYTAGDYEDLASKLKILLDNADLRTRMGDAARNWACQRFTQERFREDLTRLLRLAHLGAEPHPAESPPGANFRSASVAAQREGQ